MEEEKIFCLSCGQAIPKDSQFCLRCGAAVRSRETKVPSEQGVPRLCMTCGRSHPAQYSFCPYCGAYPGAGQIYPSHQRQPLGNIRYVAYIVAFLIPIVGLIWGIIWAIDRDGEKKHAGKITIVISLLTWLLNCIIVFVLLTAITY